MRLSNSNDEGYGKLLILDVETTGLKPHRDEVIALTILDDHGSVLLDERFGARHHQQWSRAEAVHGISPNDVKGLPTIAARAGHVTEILHDAAGIIGYNLDFDLAFLRSAGVRWRNDLPLYDVMKSFARAHGLRSGRHPQGRWVPLVECARYYGYEFTPHSSLEDARATLFCFERLRREGELGL